MPATETSLLTLQKEIAELELLLAAKKRQFEEEQAVLAKQTVSETSPSKTTNNSSSEAKITLFRSLFRGREDVYAKRFESKKQGNPVTSLHVETNRFEESEKNQK